MRRSEWLVVLALLALTVSTVAFASPPRREGRADATLVPPTVEARAEGLAQATLEQGSGSVFAASPTPTALVSGQPTVGAVPSATATARPSAASSATATQQPSATETPRPTPTATTTPFPFDTRPDLERYVYVDQRVQHMYVFERGQLVRDIPCSTGLPNDNTYTEAWSGTIGDYWGTFYSFGTYQDDAWYLYKSLGSILVHSLPYTEVDGVRVYQGREHLGVRPSSHGCIRLSPEDARWFTAWNPKGVFMTISDPYRDLWR